MSSSGVQAYNGSPMEEGQKGIGGLNWTLFVHFHTKGARS